MLGMSEMQMQALAGLSDGLASAKVSKLWRSDHPV